MAIQKEYRRTATALMAVKGESELLEANPALQHAIRVRNPYVDPLNYIQVEMLRRLRELPDPHGPEAQALHEVAVLTSCP